MRVTFFSNYLNAHVLPLCEELRGTPGVELAFVALAAKAGNVGRENLNETTPWVVRAYEGGEQEALAVELVQDSDVVVFGHMSGREGYVETRVATGALTFRSAERILKRGDAIRFLPPKMKRTHEWFGRYARCSNFHMLCVGGHAARDLSKSGFPLEKCRQWGYFTEVPEVLERSYAGEDEPLSLLWAGRMLDWKRPVDALRIVADLVDSGSPVRLRMAGDGDEMERVRAAIADWGLQDSVELLGLVEAERVHELMCTSDALLNTSARKEGWGAAVSEAMARGCIVISNDQAGAPATLVREGQNGFLYPDGRLDAAESCVAWLAADRARVRAVGEAARETMTSTWNARVAARNLLQLSEALLAGEEPPELEGPCALCAPEPTRGRSRA